MSTPSGFSENLKHWNSMAEKHGDASIATIPDPLLKEIELDSIYKFIPDNPKLLDIGCGNGFSAFLIAERMGGATLGLDFSPEMISHANSRLRQDGRSNLSFDVGDVLALERYAGQFDTVLSERCIINLENWELQKTAIQQIASCLEPGGLYIMAEAFSEPLVRLNNLRASVNLPDIQVKWHNVYLSEAAVLDYASQWFELVEIDPYSSTYYFLTRAVSPKLAEMQGYTSNYDDPINLIGATLPAFGDFGPQKTIAFKRR